MIIGVPIDPCVRPLEGQFLPALTSDDDPAFGVGIPSQDVLIDVHPKEFTVELGEVPRLRTVDHRLLEATNHSPSISVRLGSRTRVDALSEA